MSFSPFTIREDPFIDNIVDYTIPYNIESPIILTSVKDEMKANLFSYFTVFNNNVWSVIFISVIIMLLIVSINRKMLLIEQHFSFETYSEIFLRFYASFLNKGIK